MHMDSVMQLQSGALIIQQHTQTQTYQKPQVCRLKMDQHCHSSHGNQVQFLMPQLAAPLIKAQLAARHQNNCPRRQHARHQTT